METKPNKSSNSGPNNYMKYSGVGFQIVAYVIAGVLVGYGLDKWIKPNKPYFTIICSFTFTIVGLVVVFRDLLKNK